MSDDRTIQQMADDAVARQMAEYEARRPAGPTVEQLEQQINEVQEHVNGDRYSAP
jgi:hypothetical protein